MIDNFVREVNKSFSHTFTKEEVIALINRVLDNKPELESNGVVVNYNDHTIAYNGKPIHQPKKVVQLCYYLIQNKNRLVRRNEIIRDVWGSDVIVGDRTIDVHIKKIRKLLDSRFIRTQKSVGYKWEEININ
jgi:two-component system alkaline phosphatase synthesis response regulator PhoP